MEPPKRAKINLADPAPAPVPAPLSDAEICLTVICSALNKKKLPVTVGEVRRRMAAPECMDIAAVGRLTKQPKSSKLELQRSLIKCGFATDENGFAQPFNNRTISCLLEADAMTLAGDYRKVMTHQLPTDVILAIIVDAAGPAFHTHKDAIMQHLHRVKDHFVSAGRQPGQARLDPTNADQAAMHRFSLETHGLGPAAAIAVMDALTVVFTTPVFTSEFAQKPPPSDVDARLLAHPDDDADVYDRGVIARFAFDCKIPVTNGELRRRVFGPEKAVLTDVSTYLRKAKDTAMLREWLSDVDIEVVMNRKIKKTKTVFALVTEQESMALARETAERLAALPPSAKILQGAREHPEAALAIRKITAALAAAMVRVGATPAEARAENEQDRHILRFAMYSHHFGHNYYASVMRWMHDVFAQVC